MAARMQKPVKSRTESAGITNNGKGCVFSKKRADWQHVKPFFQMPEVQIPSYRGTFLIQTWKKVFRLN